MICIYIFSDYATGLIETLLQEYNKSPSQLKDSIKEIRSQAPKPLAAEMVHPDNMEEDIKPQTRFAKKSIQK